MPTRRSVPPVATRSAVALRAMRDNYLTLKHKRTCRRWFPHASILLGLQVQPRSEPIYRIEWDTSVTMNDPPAIRVSPESQCGTLPDVGEAAAKASSRQAVQAVRKANIATHMDGKIADLDVYRAVPCCEPAGHCPLVSGHLGRLDQRRYHLERDDIVGQQGNR